MQKITVSAFDWILDIKPVTTRARKWLCLKSKENPVEYFILFWDSATNYSAQLKINAAMPDGDNLGFIV